MIKDLFNCKKYMIVYDWFKVWENEGCDGVDVYKRYKSFLKMEIWEDLDYFFYGFMLFVDICIDKL